MFATYEAWLIGYDPGPTLADRLALARPRWMSQASCRGMDVALFFPASGDHGLQAKRVCAGCPVRVECRAFAVDTGAYYGIWGGKGARPPGSR